MPQRILVFPCGSEVGLEIHRAIRYSMHFELVGASSVDDHGSFVFEEFIGGLPDLAAEDFLDQVELIVEKHKIDAIYPATDAVAETLSAWAGERGFTVIGSSPEVARVCAEKLSTYQALEGVVPVPKIYSNLEQSIDFPIFIKPNRGHSSIDTFRAVNFDSAVNFLSTFDSKEMLLLEDLPGPEWTVDCFSDRHGELRFHLARHRSRIKSGISMRTTQSVEVGQDFGEWARAINKRLRPRGAWFFQAKASLDGLPKLLEVGLRPAGSSALSRCQGVNLPLLSAFDAFGVDVDIQPNSYAVTLDRALGNSFQIDIEYTHIYVDLDDCLVLRGRLNSQLLSFLLQSRAEGRKIILLTRSDIDPETVLNHLMIGEIFDQIFHLTDKQDKKSSYIESRKSIFIDDSYVERADVASNLGIPVFAPDMIEALVQL